MTSKNQGKYYTTTEEMMNISTHAIGLVLSCVALVALINKASIYGGLTHIISAIVFGISLIILYAASTFYHSATKDVLRSRLRIVDHSAIYFLIAGTYTPFMLIVLNNQLGWVIFGICWSMAVTGVVLKLFFTGRFDKVSTVMYLIMGWMIVFAINPLKENLSQDGIDWLFAGGISYTIGAILYAIKQIKFNHALFHLFVLAGSTCHFISIYFYVLPISHY